MRILVTGSAGFMGSHLFEHLLKEGHEVYGIDNYSLGFYEHPNIKIVDLTNKEKVEQVVSEIKPELIYHLAAWAHEGLSQFAPIKITENNYMAFLNLIVPAIKNGLKKIVVTSSMSVYGDQEPPFYEELKPKPVDVYAVAKYAMEESLKVLADVHGFEYVIIRPHNVYGERQRICDPYRNVVGIFMNRVMKNLPPIVYGDGEQTRSFSYIGDVTPYIAKAGFSKECNSQIINIGPTEAYTINELAREVLNALGSDLEPVYIPDRPREVKHAYCTNHKAKILLGYDTKTPFSEGIRKMSDWARSVGSQEFCYLDQLELVNDKTPETWKNKKMSK